MPAFGSPTVSLCSFFPFFPLPVAVHSMGSITSGHGVANMKRIIRRVGLLLLLIVVFVAGAGIPHAAPVRSGSTDTISDRKAYIPNLKNLPLPGKVICILAEDRAPITGLDGQAASDDQLFYV